LIDSCLILFIQEAYAALKKLQNQSDDTPVFLNKKAKQNLLFCLAFLFKKFVF